MDTENRNSPKRRPLPVGIDRFSEICDEDYYYVDKTLLIRELIDNKAKTVLFTRPRRFGKSLNMDMLRTFFEKTNENGDTARYFRDKRIWGCGPAYTEKQGTYPVIHLSFHGIEASNLEEMLKEVKIRLQDEYSRQLETLDLQKLRNLSRKRFVQFVDGEPDRTDTRTSLRILTQVLHEAHGVAPIVLIDEYDAPVENAWAKGFYEEAVEFMRGLLSPALKGNQDMSYAWLTGVLRVAREGLFSGLNNLKVDGVLSERYDEFFGFTEDEIREMVRAYVPENKTQATFREVKDWYEGYRFGNREVFNPWSVVNYFDEGCRPEAYWANTSRRQALGEVLLRGNGEFLKELGSLLDGGTVWSTIQDSLVYPELLRGDASETAYTLLLMSGYLTPTGKTQGEGGRGKRELVIPNTELRDVYPREILEAMPDEFRPGLCRAVQDAVQDNKPDELEKALTELLMQTVSFFDLESEKEYQTWLLGLLASMPGYRLTSNREAGKGRFDICLRPKTPRHPGVLIEVKLEKNKKASRKKRKNLALRAIRQIRDMDYAADLRADGVSDILEFGLAFSGKTVCVVTGKDVPEEKE